MKIQKYFKRISDGLFGDIKKTPEGQSHFVAFSVSTGLFWCFTPTVFFQQAAIGLYWVLVRKTRLNFNFPIAWAWTWWSNPVTVLPLYYFYFRIGEIVFTTSEKNSVTFDLSNKEAAMTTVMPYISQILIGSIICSISSALISYYLVLFLIRRINRKDNIF
ncbi:DUF2062 domain-containing protein [Pseudoalteromonas maricaloris]|uniref:DUF2062 domain-containing protein n=1 Tax=Pseudoalteromonas maricaloris TaxID=184924 RepID=UPI00058013E8|nr:DUF2062 domain-containing protein [Pseudoalteromonas flavipulchra]KID36208.1 hypothetical protein QT15_11350 [Pseudoalteromonas flavipulchra NCIMB 2033 = ATCC BAA-314]